MNLSLLPLNTDNIFRVRCDGPVSLRGQPGGTDPLEALLGPKCFAHKILLSLEGSQSIDTSGIAWLMRTHNAFTQAGGTLVLHDVPLTVLDLLEVLRLPPLLNLADDGVSACDLIRDLAADTAREEDEEVAEPVLRLQAS
jgi:ABC-type transporter Mla MlaB component